MPDFICKKCCSANIILETTDTEYRCYHKYLNKQNMPFIDSENSDYFNNFSIFCTAELRVSKIIWLLDVAFTLNLIRNLGVVCFSFSGQKMILKCNVVFTGKQLSSYKHSNKLWYVNIQLKKLHNNDLIENTGWENHSKLSACPVTSFSGGM